MVLSEFSISVVLDLQQIARELEELLAFGRLLGIRMEGTLAAVGMVSMANFFAAESLWPLWAIQYHNNGALNGLALPPSSSSAHRPHQSGAKGHRK